MYKICIYIICYIPRYLPICIYIYIYWALCHRAIGCEVAHSLALNQGELLAGNRRVGSEPAASRGLMLPRKDSSDHDIIEQDYRILKMI